jgi:hypothetical protein
MTGERRVLFSIRGFRPANRHQFYDVTPDDQRFVFVGPVGITGRELIVFENWFEELKAKVRN